MSNPRILIAGGGVSGLVAAWAFQSNIPCECRVIEGGKPGGEFTAGGLKYLHKTEAMEEMFHDLDLPHSTYTVRGGILLQGRVLPYPKCLQSMTPERSLRIQRDHYRKTRRTSPDDFAKKAMNDPAALGPRRALRADFSAMIEKLCEDTTFIEGFVTKVNDEENCVHIGDEVYEYDYLIMTLPLWVIREVCSFYVPEGGAMILNVVQVNPRHDPCPGWDYVYTPYTPADAVHRMSTKEGGWSLEVNGKLDRIALESDIQFIFPDGYSVEHIREGLKGHLLPLQEQPKWPENIAPIGRFARWDPRSTTDVALRDTLKLIEKWGL